MTPGTAGSSPPPSPRLPLHPHLSRPDRRAAGRSHTHPTCSPVPSRSLRSCPCTPSGSRQGVTNKDTEARGGRPAKHPVVGIPGKEGRLCGAHLEWDGSGLQLSTSSLAAPCRYPGRLRWGQVKGTVPVPSSLCTPGSLGLGVPDGEGQATPGPGAGHEPQGPTWTLDVTTAVRLGAGSSRRF